MSYTCQNCGSFAEEPRDLCKPAEEELGSKLCDSSNGEICNGKMAEMRYTCDACGCISADTEHLCSPSRVI